MAKLTNAQLTALVTRLEAENKELKGYIQGCSDMIEGEGTLAVKIESLVAFKKQVVNQKTIDQAAKHPIKLPGGQPTSIRVEDEKVLVTMKWLMKYVNYTGDMPSDEFLGTFEIYTNRDKSWLAIYPSKGLAGTGAFIKGLNQARHARQVHGNYWRNHGMWCNIPKK